MRKLRLLVVTAIFLVIASIATVFGLLTSVASDLPQLSNQVQYRENVDSVLEDDSGKVIGTLAPPNKPVIDDWSQISQNMVHAIVATEDRHFWTDPGVQWTSVARAFLSDITGGPKQGASTIAEEFVKNALAEENNRTVFEKLREAGMAFQLVHRWKRTKVLTQYLNIIYFGNGAYGIEAAARLYFGKALGYDPNNPSGGRCGTASAADPHLPTCASRLAPYQAAMLAALVANPTEFDPIAHPQAAIGRRNQVVLAAMYHLGYLTRGQYLTARGRPLPRAADLEQASEPAAAPYFTAWVRPLIIRALEREGVPARLAPYEAYYGGLKVKLTLDLRMQQAAQAAVKAEFGANPNGPTATVVSIDNATGEVRAMVSGDGDYSADPFNLAAYGYRQPGSSFKVFTLVQALESGRYGPGSIIDSAPENIPFRQADGTLGHFPVHNDEDTYLGPISLAEATAVSDNSVFAQIGMRLGTPAIARQAQLLGVRSPVSTNPAMIIGGLTHGVSALDMAHAYETLATGGMKVYNPLLGDIDQGPVGVHSIIGCRDCRRHDLINHPVLRRVVPEAVAADVHELLAGVVARGTGTAAAIPGVEVVGKTGTTSNYIDAWFCGWTSRLTTCVWVGYPNSAKPMTTNWNGGPVMGGTYPAVIWHDYTEAALNILAQEAAPSGSTATSTVSVLPASTGANTGNTGGAATSAPTTAVPTTPATSAVTSTVPAGGAQTAATPAAPSSAATAPAAPATTPAAATPPAATPAPAPAPTPAPTQAPAGGGSGATTSGGTGLGGG